MEEEFYEGRRLSYDGNLCTVRYIGEISGTKGQWLGVEWDDASRGKHSGSHNGREYFKCLSRAPTAGSFVRPHRPQERPVDFVTAITNKYGSNPQKGSSQSIEAANEKAIRISGKEVEEVGFEKIKLLLANLRELRIVLLDHLCLSRPVARSASLAKGYASDVHDRNEVESTCPRVSDLDLGGNLFEEWDEILDICRQLSQLTTLKCDRNRLRTVKSSRFDAFLEKPPFTRLKNLSLDDTLLAWPEVILLLESFPSLATLSFAGNELTFLRDLNIPVRLTFLSLERNEIKALEDLRPLARLESLQKISLKGNSINAIKHSSADSTLNNEELSFPSALKEVDLSYNRIDSWEFIDLLNRVFPGMSALRVSGNPLYVNVRAADGRRLDADDGYMLTLARIGNLTRLNFSQITDKERLNAETYYLSQIAQELSQADESDQNLVLSRHVRYEDLCSIYGVPVIRSKVQQTMNPNSLAARLTNFTFILDGSVQASVSKKKVSLMGNTIQLELPRSFSVYTIQGVVGKALGLSPMLLKLVWITEEEELVHGDEYESSDSDSEEHPGVIRGTKLREEVLFPRTRPIGTWIEQNQANVRVEWSAQDVARNEEAKKQIQIPTDIHSNP